ncbi:MAG: hypothetical protein LAO78_16780 [Acidobacteriia bacterium]|nr:hypothetical protein [Terriglobia bacterium]
MSNFFSQVVRPVWVALESCTEMVASNAPDTMKVDALVSRAVHAFNRSRFDQSMRETAPNIGPPVVRSAAEYFQSEVVGKNSRVNEPEEHK